MQDTEQPKGRGRPRLPLDHPNALARWLDREGVRPAALAEVLRVRASTVYGWRSGKRPPSRRMAARIEAATAGAVPAGSWDVVTGGPGGAGQD